MNALEGQFLNAEATKGVYTSAFPRGSDRAVFVVSVLQVVGTSAKLEIDIEHKNRADVSWTVAASFASTSTEGIITKSVTGLLEEIRLKCVVPVASTWARLLIHKPVWGR